MEISQINDYIKSRLNVYSYHRSQLKSVDSVEKFIEVSNNLLEDVFDDDTFENSDEFPKSTPVINALMRLRDERIFTLNFFNIIKSLRNF